VTSLTSIERCKVRIVTFLSIPLELSIAEDIPGSGFVPSPCTVSRQAGLFQYIQATTFVRTFYWFVTVPNKEDVTNNATKNCRNAASCRGEE
jgi:hypothetical protein